MDAAGKELKISILGVNQIGKESGNAGITAGRSLPWLQDTIEASVWDSLEITYRDVLILDAENHPVAVYNLTTYNLGDPANYESLKALLIRLASQ